MQRLKTAWRLFCNAWKEFRPGYPVQVIIWMDSPPTKKQQQDIQAIADGKSHARTFPRRKQGSLREVVNG